MMDFLKILEEDPECPVGASAGIAPRKGWGLVVVFCEISSFLNWSARHPLFQKTSTISVGEKGKATIHFSWLGKEKLRVVLAHVVRTGKELVSFYTSFPPEFKEICVLDFFVGASKEEKEGFLGGTVDQEYISHAERVYDQIAEDTGTPITGMRAPEIRFALN